MVSRVRSRPHGGRGCGLESDQDHMVVRESLLNDEQEWSSHVVRGCGLASDGEWSHESDQANPIPTSSQLPFFTSSNTVTISKHKYCDYKQTQIL